MMVGIPRGIPTAVTDEEAARLAELAAGCDVLELGAWHGFSTVLLAQVARRVTSVDWHGGDEHAGEGDTWESFRSNLSRFGVTPKVDARRGRFADVLPGLLAEGRLFDGVFLDAQHDAASVRADLALALPLVRPGGWVAFHDYGRSEETGHPGFGVTEVADEFGISGVTGHLAWGRRPGGPADRAPERTMTVAGLPFAPDGSGYYRMWLPFKHLAENSRHLFAIPDPGARVPDPSPSDVADLDVLVLQRPAFARGRRQMDRLAGHVARVYETDDDLLTVEPSNDARFAADSRSAASVRYCLERADLVTVSTPYLAELYAPFNPNVVVLPNMVKASLLDRPRIRRERVTLGWQGGDSHLVDMCSVQEPLRDVLNAHPRIDMHFMGTDYSPLLWTGTGLARSRFRATPWHADIADYYRAVDFDIAIAPLAGVPFNRSKSHLKALEAAAMGIPVIASDAEPYRSFVRDGETGYLVRTPDEWRSRLRELINDEDAREEMGAKARQVAAGYTIEGNWRLWESAYESVA